MTGTLFLNQANPISIDLPVAPWTRPLSAQNRIFADSQAWEAILFDPHSPVDSGPISAHTAVTLSGTVSCMLANHCKLPLAPTQTSRHHTLLGALL